MMAGGHFLSDVIWAGGLVWLTALVLHHALELDRAPAPLPDAEDPRHRRKARWVTVASGSALGALTVAALLATPYVSAKTFTRSAAALTADPAPVLEVALDEATLAVAAGPELQASYDVQAFGFPTSKVGLGWHPTPAAAVLSLDRIGWFTERRTRLALLLPADGAGKQLRVRLGKGKVALDLRGFAPAARLELEVGEGEVRVTGAEALDDGRAVVRVRKGQVVRE
ncbi:MAG: hypothetical protein QM767_19255 [Anaeromyxobacter sp.]